MEKFGDAVGAFSRWALATVSVWSFFMFISLLSSGNSKAAELAGQALGRAVICGGIAGFWFYKARKPKASAPSGLIPNLPSPEPPEKIADTSDGVELPKQKVLSAVNPTSPSGQTASSVHSQFPTENVGPLSKMRTGTFVFTLGAVISLVVGMSKGFPLLYLLLTVGWAGLAWHWQRVEKHGEVSKALVPTIAVLLGIGDIAGLTYSDTRRFQPVAGAPNIRFDTKTSQNCWAGPVGFDVDAALSGNAPPANGRPNFMPICKELAGQ